MSPRYPTGPATRFGRPVVRVALLLVAALTLVSTPAGADARMAIPRGNAVKTTTAASPIIGCPGGQSSVTVSSSEALVDAADEPCVSEIVVNGQLRNVPTFRLGPGKSLVGANSSALVAFAPAGDGVQMSTDDGVRSLRLETAPDRRAVFNDTRVTGLGTLALSDVTTVGSVQLLVDGSILSGNVVVDGLEIVAADTRNQTPAPQLITPSAVLTARPGAFTLWNRQVTGGVTVEADIQGVSIGSRGAPVSGSGVFVSGGWNYIGPDEYADAFGGQAAGDLVRTINADGQLGKVRVSRLGIGAVYTDSGIADEQKGSLGNVAVLVLFNAPVEQLTVDGPIVCTGVNSGGVDLFSDVPTTTINGPITTYGQTGIAVVTWATEGSVKVAAPIETWGPGGRGFNVYAGSVSSAEFDQITTHGDGAIGLELRRRVDRVVVHHGIQTYGGIGLNLVIGQLVPLAANAVDVDQGSQVGELVVDGPISTAGDGVHAVMVGKDSGILALYANGGVQVSGSDAAEFDVRGGTLQVRTG